MDIRALPTARYALAPDVFVCVADDDLVFLDLPGDRYLALQREDAAGLRSLVHGWPAIPDRTDEASASGEARSLAAALRDRGVLTEHISRGKDATPISVTAPTEELTSDVIGKRPATRILDAVLIAKACMTGKWLKRNRSIEQIVARMRNRRQRAGVAGRELDRNTAQRLLFHYGSLRTFFISTHNACILECIVLLELFAHYGIYPEWLFGVKTRPFIAHCWLQHEQLVLNDTMDRVSGYRPIMAV